jgi:preprotein translocase subunit YajC
MSDTEMMIAAVVALAIIYFLFIKKDKKEDKD